MAGSRDWGGLPVDMLECISGRLTAPKDFVRFRAVCPHWRDSIPVTHARFPPWILKTDEVDSSGDILFYSLASDEFHKKHVPALKGRRTRLAGFGAGLLIGVDCDDELAAVLVNPLTGDSSPLPRLPEWSDGCLSYGFVTDPKVTRETDSFVAIYEWQWPVGQKRRNLVALWRRGDAAGWATIPSEKFWPMMPECRRRLAQHGPKVLQDELAAAAGGSGNGGEELLVPGRYKKILIEHEGQVRFLSRHQIYKVPLPKVDFELHDKSMALVDWAHAPELRDKIILQSNQDTQCYVIPASDDLVGLGLSKNCIYYLSHLRGSGGDYYLCKWDLQERVATATVVKQIPGVWVWVPGKWFLPTLRKCSCAAS